MHLRELIDELSGLNPETIVKYGFGEPMSWRGDYYELAFEPVKDTTIGSMLEYANSALGSTYEGYKGGEFTMHENSEVYIASYGSTGEAINSSSIREWGGV